MKTCFLLTFSTDHSEIKYAIADVSVKNLILFYFVQLLFMGGFVNMSAGIGMVVSHFFSKVSMIRDISELCTLTGISLTLVHSRSKECERDKTPMLNFAKFCLSLDKIWYVGETYRSDNTHSN